LAEEREPAGTKGLLCQVRVTEDLLREYEGHDEPYRTSGRHGGDEASEIGRNSAGVSTATQD